MIRICPERDAQCPNGMDCSEPCGAGQPSPLERVAAFLKERDEAVGVIDADDAERHESAGLILGIIAAAPSGYLAEIAALNDYGEMAAKEALVYLKQATEALNLLKETYGLIISHPKACDDLVDRIHALLETT